MKICFFTYSSAFQNVGGGEIQLLKTREYLQKEGVVVDLFDPWKSRIEDYDVLHVFSSVKESLGVINVARSRRVKVVTSPVLWSDFRRAIHADGGVREKADLLLRHAMKVTMPRFPSARRKVLTYSDILLPNSEAEKKQITRLFAVNPEKIHVVPNGVDERFADSDPALFRKQFGNFSFALSVGRIEPRKNQLNLVRAMKSVKGLQLVLIGSPVTGYEEYYKRCLQEAPAGTLFLETVNHADPLLASAYAACDVFVLQGWFETPGLVALEAALAGASVAATSGGSTREYFENFAEYLNPAHAKDIARAVQAAWKNPKLPALKNHVRSHFIWSACARKTLQAYETALALK